MSGHKPFKILHDQLSATPEGRARMQTERELLRELSTISRLREVRGATPKELASAWDAAGENGSEDERRWASHLVILRNYIAALGGRLECNAVFPDQCIPLEARFDTDAASEIG